MLDGASEKKELVDRGNFDCFYLCNSFTLYVYNFRIPSNKIGSTWAIFEERLEKDQMMPKKKNGLSKKITCFSGIVTRNEKNEKFICLSICA